LTLVHALKRRDFATIHDPIRIHEVQCRSATHVKEHQLEYLIWQLVPGTWKRPAIQNDAVDAVRNDGRGDVRVQNKSAQLKPGRPGAKADLKKCAGKDDDGNQIHGPYGEGDNDEYIIGYYDEQRRFLHLWRFEEKVLIEKGYIGPNATESITVHAGTPNEPERGIRPLVREDYSNSTSWTRAHHTRHVVTDEMVDALNSGEYLEVLMEA